MRFFRSTEEKTKLRTTAVSEGIDTTLDKKGYVGFRTVPQRLNYLPSTRACNHVRAAPNAGMC